MEYLMIEANEGCKDVHILAIPIISHDMCKLLLQACRQPGVQCRIYGINSLCIMDILKKF